MHYRKILVHLVLLQIEPNTLSHLQTRHNNDYIQKHLYRWVRLIKCIYLLLTLAPKPGNFLYMLRVNLKKVLELI